MNAFKIHNNNSRRMLIDIAPMSFLLAVSTLNTKCVIFCNGVIHLVRTQNFPKN